MFKPGLVSAIIIKAILLALSVTGCAPAEYDIEAEANPKDAGEVSGEGTFKERDFPFYFLLNHYIPNRSNLANCLTIDGVNS